MPVKTKSKQSKRRIDPNQLSLLDYVPPARADASAASENKRKRAKRAEAIGAAPAIMSPKDAARYLNLSHETLKRWRKKRKGPTFTKIGARLIGYAPADLDAFLAANRSR